MSQFADLIKDEFADVVEFFVDNGSVFDKSVKEAPVFYKLLGDSRFRLVRNNKFELVFVHLTEDWMRQAKVDLNEVDCSNGIYVKLTWGEEQDNLGVKGINDADYQTSVAMQIDN